MVVLEELDKQVRLEPRELEVLQLLAEGYRDKGIAALMYLSPSTVESYVKHICDKLQVHTRTHAVAYALRHQWIV